jgi:SpoVK/Ycf46/Vps4 family AAA+-type ATPase
MNCAENCASRGVVWIGTANRPKNLDPAIIRAGRADIKMPIGNMKKFAVADMVKYSLYKYEEKKSANDFDYQKVIDTMEDEDFIFTPAELDLLVKNATKMKLGKEKPLTADMLIDEMVRYRKAGFHALSDITQKRFTENQRYMNSIDKQDIDEE